MFEFSGIVDVITGVIGMIIYPLFSILFVLIAAVQRVFEVFAGIGEMSFGGTNISSGNTGAETDTGIVYYLLTYPLVKNLLLSIMILALFLVIVFTAMAFIKNMYAAKQKGWKEIVGNAIKGLANFIFIPVCCVLGVWLGNILLNAINGATSKGGATTMERKLFIASAYNANLYRTGEASGRDLAVEVYNLGYGSGGETAVKEGLTDEEYANIVDSVYSQTDIDLTWWQNVGKHYALWQINYIVLVVGGIFMLYVLGSMAFAMVRRLFYIVILFVISPGVCALYPLDEGGAVGSWKGEFVKQVVSAYGAVAGLNIFFSIVPLIEKIQLFSGDNWFTKGFGINDIAHIFILTCGLMVVKELIGTFSGWFKGEDVLGKGSSYMKDSKAKVLDGSKKAQKYAGVFSKPVEAAAKGVWGAAKGAGRVAKGGLTSLGHGLSSAGKGIGKVAGKGLDAVKNSKAGVAVRQGIYDINQERLKKKERKAKEKELKNLMDGKYFKYAKQHDLFLKDKDGNLVGDGEYDLLAAQQLLDAEEATKAEKKAEKKARRKDKWDKAKEEVGRVASDVKKVATKAGTGVKNVATKAANGVKNSAFGQAVAEESKNFVSGAKKVSGAVGDFMSSIADETGMTKLVDDNFKEYGAARKRYADRTKKRTEGAVGENKIIDKVSKMDDALFTQIANAMGDLADAVAKRFIKNNEGILNNLGLDKNATKAEITNIDNVMNKLNSLADRANNADGDARKEIIKEAMKIASTTDASGNNKFADALNDALKEFAKASREDGMKVTLDADSIKNITKASKDAGAAMVKELAENTAEIVAEVEKNKK